MAREGMFPTGTPGSRASRRGPSARALAAGVAVVLSGCDSPARQPDAGPVLERSATRSAGDAMDALVAGVLEMSGGCLYVRDSGASVATPVIWPTGTTWDPEAHAVNLPSGEVIAIGETVELGGGFVNADRIDRITDDAVAERAMACAHGESGEFVVVNNDLED